MSEEKCRMLLHDTGDEECNNPAVARVYPKTAGGRWVPMCEEHLKDVPPEHPGLHIEMISSD